MQSSALVDPFQGLSILSLNPRTFRDSKDALKPKDLEAIHQHMNSMALRSPNKHFGKAKSVLDCGLEILDTKESEANTKDKENRQDHRPGLARKRAKFSLVSTSQPATVMEPTFQIDQLQDPEEFFAAYEKFENTKKELKRQRGEELHEAKNPTAVRHRRPEIPRRKAIYKHYEYSSQSKNNASSQETFQDNIGSPASQYSQPKSVTPIQDSKEEEVFGSVAKTEDRINKLYDDLMASQIGNLDENGALSFLKDRLKIKPVNANELQLPNFHDIPRVDFMSPVNKLMKEQSILFDSCALPDGIKEKTPGKQKKVSDNPFLPLASPLPSKSPLAAISSFGKHMLKAIESDDPFSARDIDSLPVTTSIENIGRRLTHVSKDQESPVSGRLDLLTKNKVTVSSVGDVSQKVPVGALVNSPKSDKALSDSNRHSVTTLSESMINMEVHEQCHIMEERDVDDNVVSTCVVTADIQTNEGNAEDLIQKTASVTKPNCNDEDITYKVHPHCEQDIHDNIETVTEKVGSTGLPELAAEVSMTEDSNQPGVHSVEDPDASRPAQVSDIDIVPERQNEHSRISMNKRKKSTRPHKVDLKKRRQSLAEAGSSWTSGIRRSNRIRRRPLEYWKGERLLYGRVHNSLPTVIGVKYLSPTKDNGKPGFKVESFVSNKYKDLVELVARH